jgi:hypothetical protein
MISVAEPMGQIRLPNAEVERIRGMVTAWVYSVDPQASIATAEEFTSIMVTAAEATGAAVADRIRPILGMLQPVITAARTHAEHDLVLRDALATYDAAREAIQG